MKLQSIKPKVAMVDTRRVATAVAPLTTWGKEQGGRPWRRLVEAVKRRDQYTCQACGRVTDQGECDHIVPISQGGGDEMSNLQWLCAGPGLCHALKTQREALAGRKDR